MEQIHKSYKFRLYLTQKQEELLLKHFGCTRWVYNHFLLNEGLRISGMVIPSTQAEAKIRHSLWNAQAYEVCSSM